MKQIPSDFRHEAFLDLITQGFSETAALAAIEYPRTKYLLIKMRHEEFGKRLEEAKKERATVFYDKIAQSSDDSYTKDEVPSEKLRFEKLKYLAEKDDPERFGDKKTINSSTTISIQDFRNMTDKQAQQILTSNPFANVVDAEFTPVAEETTDEEDLL